MLWDTWEILDVIQLTYVYFACSDNGQLYLRVVLSVVTYTETSLPEAVVAYINHTAQLVEP